MHGSIIEIVADYAHRDPKRLCVADKTGHIPMVRCGRRLRRAHGN